MDTKVLLSKISSRKFWALVAGVATSILVIFKAPDTVILQVAGLIGAIGSVVGYMFSEAWVDAAKAGSEFTDEVK
jgi:hypothetical protein